VSVAGERRPPAVWPIGLADRTLTVDGHSPPTQTTSCLFVLFVVRLLSVFIHVHLRSAQLIRDYWLLMICVEFFVPLRALRGETTVSHEVPARRDRL
jgi:hypothetical protein